MTGGVHRLGEGEVTILKSFYLSIPTVSLLHYCRRKRSMKVVNMRPPPGTLGRHSNQVQHNLLSYAPLAMSDFTVMMKSKKLSHYRRHCHLESCGRQNLLLIPHGPVGNTLSGTFAWAPTAVSLCKFSASSLALLLCVLLK